MKNEMLSFQWLFKFQTFFGGWGGNAFVTWTPTANSAQKYDVKVFETPTTKEYFLLTNVNNNNNVNNIRIHVHSRGTG